MYSKQWLVISAENAWKRTWHLGARRLAADVELIFSKVPRRADVCLGASIFRRFMFQKWGRSIKQRACTIVFYGYVFEVLSETGGFSFQASRPPSCLVCSGATA